MPWCRFIARLGKGSISVYELPDMVLLDKKSLKLEGVQDFAWSPSQPVLCAYQTEQAGGNLPARISLISFPEKRELRQKNLFSVSGAPFAHDSLSAPCSVSFDQYCMVKWVVLRTWAHCRSHSPSISRCARMECSEE